MLTHYSLKATLLTLTGIALFSCDTLAAADVQAANDEPVTQTANTKENATPAPRSNAPDDTGQKNTTARKAVQKYATCASTCYTGNKSETNQATCKLNCRNALGATLADRPLQAAALSEVPDINDSLDQCITKCDPISNTDNQATCILNCTTAVAVKTRGIELEPTATAPALTTCDTTCSARLNVCKSECSNDDSLSVDNRATCNLNCENTVTACKRTCRAK